MDRCVQGSYEVPTVVSPSLQNEKKVTVEAAHNIIELKEDSECTDTVLNLRRIAGVIW